MAKALGRKRKSGHRTKSGRLSRAAVNFDRGTEYTQAMQALYGPNGSDSIGRAFARGLLGDPDEAKPLLDMARKVSRIYWRAYLEHPVKSCIGEKNFGTIVDLNNERVKRDETWLTETLKIVGAMGRDVRRSFEQLVIDVNPDTGPNWLNGMIYEIDRAKHLSAQRKELVEPDYDPDSVAHLRRALDALEIILE